MGCIPVSKWNRVGRVGKPGRGSVCPDGSPRCHYRYGHLRCSLALCICLPSEGTRPEIYATGLCRSRRQYSFLRHAKRHQRFLEMVSFNDSRRHICLLDITKTNVNAKLGATHYSRGPLKLKIVINAVSAKSGGAATY